MDTNSHMLARVSENNREKSRSFFLKLGAQTAHYYSEALWKNVYNSPGTNTHTKSHLRCDFFAFSILYASTWPKVNVDGNKNP